MTSYEYWVERERKQRELYMSEESQQAQKLERIYREMYQWAGDEINRFYGKYADAEGIDITTAKKRVTEADIKAYEELAKRYVRTKDFSDRANAEMRLYNATMKINRLEMLKARIGLHLVDGINTIDDYYEKVITDRTREEIERQAGILGETVNVADTTKRAENIVNATFFNATFSERIWSHQDRLRSMISIELEKGLIAGVGSRQMATNIRKEFDVSYADAHRLMVTELRRVQTDVAMDSYKASGIKRYVFMAVNPRACPICLAINGKDFAVSEAEPAKNAPPMHPRCHCTTAPYIDEDEYNGWLNYLEQGGSTSDWNKMTDAEKAPYKPTKRAETPVEKPVEKSVEPPKAVEPAMTEEERIRQETESAMADAYEYHRIKNNLNEVEYDRIKDSGVITADFKGVSTESAKVFSETLAKLCREYDTPIQTVRVGTLDGSESAFASTYHDYRVDSATIVINPLKCKDYATLMDRLAFCREHHWLIDTDQLDQYVLTHEFAHSLITMGDKLNRKTNYVGADYDKTERVRKEVKSAYDDYLAELDDLKRRSKEYEDIANESFGEDMDKFYEMGRKADEVTKEREALELGAYSLQNADEFMAEAFTYAKIGKGKNKYADRVLEILDRNYKR